jgi:hypothetical protein
MNRNSKKALAQNIQMGLWITVILLCTLTYVLRNLVVQRLLAVALALLAIHLIVAYLILKESAVLKGISAKSRISIAATFIMAAILLAVAYTLLFCVTIT